MVSPYDTVLRVVTIPEEEYAVSPAVSDRFAIDHARAETAHRHGLTAKEAERLPHRWRRARWHDRRALHALIVGPMTVIRAVSPRLEATP